ncbi:MAG: GNAT family N-acetyltransferase [Lachnospiraceae bacterium]|jgi:diamine N-acetyltransferase|nr:GNAT family N-acetyltransferase [Lachnospiraceae bacterium]MCR5354536.1 GNAT family N-acetyltransferase [Lachnospiraceae bacterium]
MKMRNLEEKDAPFMLEWMHDESVVEFLSANFAAKTIDDCKAFIQSACTETDVNMAVVDDNDEYMGTVSLKHIQNQTAEFAITFRKCAMGKGYSTYGIRSIIEYGLEELGLDSIYWCVSPDNARAVRFYDKNGYNRVDSSILNIVGDYSPEQIDYFIWYQVCK